MPQHYRFSPEGLLEPCEKDEAGSTGGFRYYNSERVKEYSDGKYEQGGWVAHNVIITDKPYSSKETNWDNGVLNPVDGKRYTNENDYVDAVKRAGKQILGNDAPTQKAKPKTESINWEKAVAETLKTSPLKGKSR